MLRTVLTALLALGALQAIDLPAQTATVYYDHRAGAKDADRLSYVLPGERVSKDNPERHLGPPPLLQVPEGGQACYVVENANPLLYTYSLASKTVAVEAPTGTAEIIAGLGAVLGGVTGVKALPGTAAQPAAGATPPPSGKEYAGAIQKLADTVAQMEKLKAESDQVTDLGPVFVRAETLYVRAQKANEVADSLFSLGKEAFDFVLLNTIQKTTWQRAQASIAEFRGARASLNPRFCVGLAEARIRATLIGNAKTKPKEGETVARPVDTLASILAEPVLARWFDVVPIVVASFGVQDAREFDVKGNTIVGPFDHGPNFAPGALFLGRIAGSLWGGLGTSTGRGKAPDLHAGLVVRTGFPTKGALNLLLGAGLSLAHVPVGLDGADIGQPVPAGRKLSDIIQYDYRIGAGLYFTLSGLSIAGGRGSTPAKAEPSSK